MSAWFLFISVLAFFPFVASLSYHTSFLIIGNGRIFGSPVAVNFQLTGFSFAGDQGGEEHRSSARQLTSTAPWSETVSCTHAHTRTHTFAHLLHCHNCLLALYLLGSLLDRLSFRHEINQSFFKGLERLSNVV
jgi:hypothetical protein